MCRIDVQGKMNLQVGKFLKNIKRADQNKAVQGGIFFSKLINLRPDKPAEQNKAVHGGFFSQN